MRKCNYIKAQNPLAWKYLVKFLHFAPPLLIAKNAQFFGGARGAGLLKHSPKKCPYHFQKKHPDQYSFRPIPINSKSEFPRETSYRKFYRISLIFMPKSPTAKTVKILGKTEKSSSLSPIKISLKSPKQNLRQNPKNRS